MSKLKTGDLVILVQASSRYCRPFLGQIHTLDSRVAGDPEYWKFSPTLFDASGLEVIWHQDDMRRIDNPGDDAVDEVIQRIGTPHKETA